MYFEHQERIVNESCERRHVGFWMDMGTGKTKVCIDTIIHLWRKGEVKNVLVLAPKGCYRNWPDDELPKWLPADIPTYIVTWSSVMPLAEKKRMDDIWLAENDNKLKIVVMNIEALSTDRGGARALSFCKHSRNLMVIIDESTSIKSSGAKRTKNVLYLRDYASYRRLCSGLPSPQSPVDMFSQLRWLAPEALPTQSYYAFRQRYCVMREVRLGPRRFNKIVGFQRMEELHGIMEKVGYRVDKSVLNLPPKIYMKRQVEMSQDQIAAYDRLIADAMVIINHADKRGVLTAPLMITRLMRIHQILCGHLVDDEGNTYNIASNRIDAMLETIEEMNGPVVIWATYRASIVDICKALSDAYGPDSVVHYYGDTDAEERIDHLEKFKEGKARFFVGNPSTGRFGLTLVNASNVIYYSNSFNLEHRLQSEDRCHRIGQEKSVTYVDLYVPRTIDEKIMNVLRQKESLAKALLSQGAAFFRQDGDR